MTRPSLKAILFDLDGTLLDTAPDLGSALNQLLIEQGKPEIPLERIRSVVSDGANAMISLAFNTTRDDPEHNPLFLRLLDLYQLNIARHTQAFPGIDALLSSIKQHGMKWGIVTNKPRFYTQQLLEQIRFDPHFDAVVCPDDVSQGKPSPEPMYLACTQIGCLPGEALYVGDHKRDIDAGRNAGMKTVAALYGYIEDDEQPDSWFADYYIDHPDDLTQLLHLIKHQEI